MTKIKQIFDHISEKESHKFEIGQLYVPSTEFEIETESGYTQVVGMIIKEDTAINLETDAGEVKVGSRHKIMTADGLRYVYTLKEGDVLKNANGDLPITSIEIGDKVHVYDLTVKAEDSLYKDAQGFVHHNTFHIVEGNRSLKAILGKVGEKWEYHSGTKAAPFSFYQTLFQERDKIIVFDEADSLLKNQDIIMMLKPILDTSGKNMAEYMSGTQNMVGKTDKEIADYSEEVDSRIKGGEPITTGRRGVKLPSKFKFEGSMIFISNMRAKEIEAAIMSRSLFVDVYLAEQDILKRIRTIATLKAKARGESVDEVEDIMEALGAASSGPKVNVTYMTPEYARSKKQITVRAYEVARILKHSGLKRWPILAALYA